jgi:orotate phosphoribosyltransferase
MSRRVSAEIDAGIRRIIALQLWTLEAVKVNLRNPFRLVSGNHSPVYINCRRLISFPSFIDLFSAAAREIIQKQNVQVDVIAGGETAGIPFAAFLARTLNQPMVYVRKQTKRHGTESRIEGTSVRNCRMLLVEDLITDAGSKLDFIRALTEAGATVKDVLVVFDRLQGGRKALKKKGIRLHAMTDMTTTLRVAQESKLISANELRSIHSYLSSPARWHLARRLPYIS